MLEILVLSACLSGSGCSEATQAYYVYNADLQTWTNRNKDRLESKLGKANLSMIGTVTGVIFMKKGGIQITKNLSLLVGDSIQLQLHWEM